MNKQDIIYCGVGSRETVLRIQVLMRSIGETLARRGWLLRSGAADGADSAFEEGCDIAKGAKEIWLPWPKFNGHDSKLLPSPEAFELAARYHPAWSKLTEGGRKLQARNSHQVLGADLETPAHIIVYYTPKGLSTGGTGQSIRIARDLSIPVVDLGVKEDWKLEEALNIITKAVEA